jgi:hypothetical protein
MNSSLNSSWLPSRPIRVPQVFLFALLAMGSGCFRGADISKIVCNETKYCPSGYVCAVPPGQTQGKCERSRDGGGSEAISSLDGAVGMDGTLALDSGLLDLGGRSVDQAFGNTDGAGAPVDTSVGVDLSPPDVPTPDVPTDKPLMDSSDSADSFADSPADLPLVADVAADRPGIDAPVKAGGAPCVSNSECASTYCADGVCCDGPCTGQCQACAEASKVGKCSTVSGAPRGTRTACAATQATCAGQCGGTLPNQCSYAGSEVTCTGATCSSDLAMNTASVCNGAGACTASSVVTCASGKYCTGGACVAQIGSGGSCQSNNQCASGNCSNSLCCATGQTGCGSSCVSLSTSSANCGSCGRVCATGSSCSGGSCYLADGQSCTTGPQCLSGVCSTFYLDGDGDGYGVGVGLSQCGTTPPAGYANKAGDCCDTDKNAFPGQTAYFATADSCGSFDYNCDASATPKSNGPVAGTCGTPTCSIVSETCTYISGCTCGAILGDPCAGYTTPSCGQSYVISTQYCGGSGGSCGPMGFGSSPEGTQACN